MTPDLKRTLEQQLRDAEAWDRENRQTFTADRALSTIMPVIEAALPQWRPITDDAKDGERVLVRYKGSGIWIAYWTDDAEFAQFARRPGWQVEKCEDGFYSLAFDPEEVDAWMPLPPAEGAAAMSEPKEPEVIHSPRCEHCGQMRHRHFALNYSDGQLVSGEVLICPKSVYKPRTKDSRPYDLSQRRPRDTRNCCYWKKPGRFDC